MGDHVRLGEVPLRPVALLKLLEEAQVEVDGLVGRAVEGTDLRGGEPAPRFGGLAEQDQLGRAVGLTGRPKLLRPRGLGVVEDERDEGHQLTLGVIGPRGHGVGPLARAPTGSVLTAEETPAAQEQDQQEDQDPPDAAAGHPHRETAQPAPRGSRRPPVDDVAASVLPPELHVPSSSPGERASTEQGERSHGCGSALGAGSSIPRSAARVSTKKPIPVSSSATLITMRRARSARPGTSCSARW